MKIMDYLFNFIHLYINSTTRIVVEGQEVLIQKKSVSSTWKLSTPIFEGRGEFPKETHECLRLIQSLKWANEGMLEIDAVIGTIHWTQEIHPSRFHKEFPRFLKHAKEWNEILTKELSLIN